MSDNARIASQFPFAKRDKGRHDAQTEQSSVLGIFPVQSVGNHAPMRPPYTENRGRRGAKAASGRKRADAESRTRGEEPYAAALPTGGKSDAKKGCLTRFRQPFFIHTVFGNFSEYAIPRGLKILVGQPLFNRTAIPEFVRTGNARRVKNLPDSLSRSRTAAPSALRPVLAAALFFVQHLPDVLVLVAELGERVPRDAETPVGNSSAVLPVSELSSSDAVISPPTAVTSPPVIRTAPPIVCPLYP